MKQAAEIYSYNITTGTWFPIATPLTGTFSSGFGIADKNYWLINTSNNEAQLIIRVYDDLTLETSKSFATDLAGSTCVIVEHHKLRSLRAIFKTGDGSVRSALQAPNANANSSYLLAFESGDVEAGMTPLFITPAIGQSANIRIII